MDPVELRYGVTGFWMASEARPPMQTEAEVSVAAHAVARSTSSTVAHICWADHRSFHEVILHSSEGALSVLFNECYPLVALAHPRPAGEIEIRFISHQPLASAFFDQTEFRPLSPDQLSRQITPDDLVELNKAELKQIAYWQPTTVGELIFNYWD